MSSPDYLDLTNEQIRDQVILEGEERSGLQGRTSVGFFRTLWETMALIVQRVYRIAIRPIAIFIDPREAPGFFLSLHGINAGAPRREARATEGNLTVTSATGGRMPTGLVLTAGAVQFETIREVVIDRGATAAVRIRCLTPGAIGNVAAGVGISWQGAPTPADAAGRLDAQWVALYGHDADDDDDLYRERVLAGYLVRGEANTLDRYRLACRGVPGVTSVAAARAPRGYGSADISVLVDGDVPDADQLDLVRAAFNEAALVARDVRVTEPHAPAVDVRVLVIGDAAALTIVAAIEAWWRANISIGDQVLVQDLYTRAAAGVAGIDSIVFQSPAQNLPAQTNTWYRPVVRVTKV